MKQSNKEKISSSLPMEIFNEQNRIRIDPKSYIGILTDYLKYFKGENKIIYKPGEMLIQTKEGRQAFLEAIKFLETQQALKPLDYSIFLESAALDHAQDIGEKGIVSHESSNGKNLSERIEKYCEWELACGENLDFGTNKAQDIIINLLVDDGIEGRPHRNMMFNEKIKYCGVAIAEHKNYEYVTVIDYVGGIRELGKPFFDYENYKYEYPDLNKNSINETSNKIKSKNQFQLEDPDAPDNTISVKIIKSTKLFKDRLHKITKKIYTLDDGSIHIVEVEDV